MAPRNWFVNAYLDIGEPPHQVSEELCRERESSRDAKISRNCQVHSTTIVNYVSGKSGFSIKRIADALELESGIPKICLEMSGPFDWPYP